MCLIMTLAAAAVFSALWAARRRRGAGAKSLFTAMLMFWAAALMWSVDGVAGVLGGGGFFDLSAADAVLGALVLACGCAVFALLFLLEKRRPPEGEKGFAA